MLLKFFQIRFTFLIMLSLILVFVGDVGRTWCVETGPDGSLPEPGISSCSPGPDRCNEPGFGIQSRNSVTGPSDCLGCIDVVIGEILQVNSKRLVQDIPPLLPAAPYFQNLSAGIPAVDASSAFLRAVASSPPPRSAVVESVRTTVLII